VSVNTKLKNLSLMCTSLTSPKPGPVRLI